MLRPGGRFVCLEITRPRPGLTTAAFRLYFDRVVPLLGRLPILEYLFSSRTKMDATTTLF